MEYSFKFKVGDIVKVYKDYWSRNGVQKKTYICVITRCTFFDGANVYNGIEGKKYPYYLIQYHFDAFGDETDVYADNDDISLLTEYWYINDNLEVCKETKVILNEQFIHRACGFGVFLDEYSAKCRLYHIKYRSNGSNFLFKIIQDNRNNENNR